MSRFTPETQAKADVFTAFLSSLDIEWSYQSTYFDDEVCVHWNGNNEPALIMSPIRRTSDVEREPPGPQKPAHSRGTTKINIKADN